MLDARPGFIIKFLKRSLIVHFYLKHELSTARLQSSTGKVMITLPVEDCRLAVKARVLYKNLRSENVSETLNGTLSFDKHFILSH